VDKNGWGDVPHRPVKLFSYVVEKVSASIVLLRSFFEEILNFAEKVSPVLTPVNLLDPEPSMNKNVYDYGKGA
jgi:nitrous oxidase accessory protein